MKKNQPLKISILLSFFMLIINVTSKSQTLGLSVSNSTGCVASGTNPVFCTITSTLPGTAMYSYSVTQTCSSGTMTGFAGGFASPTATIYLACTGPYTVFCSAINGSSMVIGTAAATGTFNSASSFSVGISPNGGAGCAGTNFTVNLSGAPSYTSAGAFGSSTNASFVVTPTTSTCFTVTASNGTCTSTASRCFTVYSPASVSLPSSVSVCGSTNYTLTPSGATSYTWSTGSNATNLVITPTASACYTVTGTTPFCATTSSASCCVSVVPAPTLTSGISTSTICLGSAVTLTGSGATNYTWTIGGASVSTSNFSTGTVVFTPTAAGSYTAQLTGNSGGCNAYSFASFTVYNNPNIVIPSTYTFCSGSGNISLVATGANNYTWSTGSNSSFITVSPTVSGCYTVTGTSNFCPGTSSAITCVTVIASPPPIVISGPTAICIGGTATYTASGGNGTYNWINANTFASYGTGSVKTISNLSNCFFVTPSGTVTGCSISNTTVCPTLLPSPTVGIIPSTFNSVCSGSNITMTGVGAISYTWSTGSSFSSINVSPSTSQCYTVTGTSANGCIGSSFYCFTVMPSPNVSISGASSACPGASLVYTANGASSYVWNNSGTSNTQNINTNVASCYTVTGTNVFGCSASVSKCFTPLATPTISIAGSNTVCNGSSATFTATGGTTYTWNGTVNSNTFSILPSTSTVISVSASHLLNTCTGIDTLAVVVNTACAIVWPGDANRDGQVDNTDVFELGLAASATGASRSGASNTWVGQLATAWSGNVSTGWNKAHADCNGDGTVNAADTVAISANYSLTHAFKNTGSTSGIDLFLVPQNSEVYGGLWNVVDIVLGDATNTQSQIYGAAFDLTFDQSMLYGDSVKLIYKNSFLNGGNQNIEFRKTKFTNGYIFAATVRTNHNHVSGSGKIGELWFKVRNDLADNSAFVFGISDGKRTDANGNMGILTTSGNMNLNLNNNATGINAHVKMMNQIRFYPNPAKDQILIKSDLSEKTTFRIMDLSGRCVKSGEFNDIKILDISELAKGVYVFEFDSSVGKIQKKLVKE